VGRVHGRLHEPESVGAASVIPAQMPQPHLDQTLEGSGAAAGFPRASDAESQF